MADLSKLDNILRVLGSQAPPKPPRLLLDDVHKVWIETEAEVELGSPRTQPAEACETAG